MGKYRVQGYASLKIGDKEHKSGDIVEVSAEVAARFNLPPADQPAARPRRDPVSGSRAAAVGAKVTAGATRSTGKAPRVGETHTAPAVDRAKETPGQTRQGPSQDAPEAAGATEADAAPEDSASGDKAASSRSKRAR